MLGARRQRLNLERQLMRAGWPALVNHIVEALAALPRVFLQQDGLAIDLEQETAAVVVEDAVHEPLTGRQIHDEFIVTGMIDFDRMGDRGGLVIRQHDGPIAGRMSAGAVA